MSLTPQDHLSVIYNARIEVTGKKIAKLNDMPLSAHKNNNDSIDINTTYEREIAMKMSESEYHRFISGYSNYLTLMYGIQDPIARDMFDKLMMYLTLKK